VIETPSSDGPVSAGVSWLFIVQPSEVAAIAAANVIIHRINAGFFISESPATGDAPIGNSTGHLGSPKFAKVTSTLPVTLTSRPVWSCP
jgi:hypothetical protein